MRRCIRGQRREGRVESWRKRLLLANAGGDSEISMIGSYYNEIQLLSESHPNAIIAPPCLGYIFHEIMDHLQPSSL